MLHVEQLQELQEALDQVDVGLEPGGIAAALTIGLLEGRVPPAFTWDISNGRRMLRRCGTFI